MKRICLAAVVVSFFAMTGQTAEPSRDEFVKWRPQRDVKDAMRQELDKFEKSLKDKLGREILAATPYLPGKNDPQGPAPKPATVEQIVDGMLKLLRKEADHDNREFMPVFAAWRRDPGSPGSDLLAAPLGGFHGLGWRGGNITFKFEWEKTGGRFKNNWDHDEVDEAYEVELNGTLTLGLDLSIGHGEKLVVISHSVTKPIVQGWRPVLVASEGEVQKIQRAP